jgi:hypothetical protein
MTQGSGWWDDQSGGDALTSIYFNSPYSAVEFAKLFQLLLNSESSNGYVFGGVDNSLNVQAAGVPNMTVIVKSGKMLINGQVYINDADATVTIATADPSNPRLDLIVAEITYASQQIRVNVVAGTAAATPARPALTRNTTTYQVAIAEVYVAAAASSITDPVIHDLREFVANFNTLVSGGYPDNMIYNSELLAAVGTTLTVPGFIVTGAAAIVGRATASILAASWHGRGNVMKNTGNSTGFWQTKVIPVQGGHTHTLKTSLCVGVGNTNGMSVNVTSDGTGPVNVTKNYFVISRWEEVRITFTVPSDATYIQITWKSLANAKDSYFGPSILADGYLTGPWRQFHGIIMWEGQGPTLDNLTGQVTGNHTINLETVFNARTAKGRALRFDQWQCKRRIFSKWRCLGHIGNNALLCQRHRRIGIGRNSRCCYMGQ